MRSSHTLGLLWQMKYEAQVRDTQGKYTTGSPTYIYTWVHTQHSHTSHLYFPACTGISTHGDATKALAIGRLSGLSQDGHNR